MTLQTWFDRTPQALRPAFLRALNLYPPFVGAGIHVATFSNDFTLFEVELRPHAWNRNFLGGHFGGSLYAMCDPFFLIALSAQLGPAYFVWDKSARIDFRRLGKGTLRARFAVTAEQIADVRAQVAAAGKSEPRFAVDVVDSAGAIVATVHKHLWVKRRALRRPTSPSKEHHVRPAA